MMTTVTPVQQAAIEQIDTDPLAHGIRRVTLTTLERDGLIRHDPNGTYHGPWYLTAAGQLLLPDVDVSAYVPSVALKSSDPFGFGV